MKSSLTPVLFCFLFLERTYAARDRLFGEPSKAQHIELPEEINAKEVGVNTNILAGRNSITTLCGPGSGITRHHDIPCDEDVQSGEESISTRVDRQTKPPESCVTDNGVYGGIGEIEVRISYNYEMQTIADNTHPTKTTDEILPKLEKAIVDSILHELFPEKCAPTAAGKRTLNEKIEIVGVSMYPVDFVTSNACNFLTPEDSTKQCAVLKGDLIVYLADDVDDDIISEEKKNIVEIIKGNMNAGYYDNSHSDITDLLYLDKLDPIESNVGNGEDGEQTSNRNRTLRMGLFVGIGTLAAVLAGVVFRLSRRMRNHDDITEMPSGGTHTYLDVEEQRPSFS